MSQPSKGVVPKFGSFKPKTTAKDPEIQEPTRRKESGGGHHQRSRSRDRHRNERKRPNSTSQRDRRRHDEREDHESRRDKLPLQTYRAPSPRITKEEFEESDLFIIDRRGDAKNVQYGSLHRYDVPAHHRFGNGRIIGTTRDARIDRDASTEKQVVLQLSSQRQRERIARPLASKSKAVESRGVRLIIPAQAAETTMNDDFIELRPSLKRKRGSESPEPDNEGVDYRSIEGKAKAEGGPDDEDMEFATDSDEGELEDSVHLEARQKNAALNKTVKDVPSDIDAWLELAEDQSNVINPGSDPSMFSFSQQRSLADIRLAIYEQALKSVSKTKPGYDSLVLGRLKEGSSLWENSKLATKWTESLKENPTSIRLWIKYLEFVQTDHIHFRYERCKAAYVECLRMLNEARQLAAPSDCTKLASAQIYTLLRFTSFVRDAGYDELAHAVWQILLEYHFFRPPKPSHSAEDLESLEAFWESDVPRVGEDGDTGWKEFEADASHASRRSAHNNSIGVDHRLSYAAFAEHESKFIDSFFLPAAADDDAESNDPFCFVMFADMRCIMENVLSELPHMELINGFLCFIQLPPVRGMNGDISHDTFFTDQYVRTFTHSTQVLQSATLTELTSIARIHNEKGTRFSIFHDAFEGRQIESAAAGFVDRVLQSLVSRLHENDGLAEYYLAFLLKFFPEKAPKFAKRLLRSRPSSLRLYDAYALIEEQLGYADKAEQVWATALKMSAAWSKEKRRDTILLTHSRMMTVIRRGEEIKALVHFVNSQCSSGDSGVDSLEISAAERLTVTRTLDEGFQATQATGLPEHATLYIDCLAWFSYLVDGHSLPAAFSVYDKYMSKLSETKVPLTLELLHQARVNLMRWHIAKKRPYKSAVVRDSLAESLRLFPENSLFYKVQSLVSAQTRIDDRLRDAFQTSTGPLARFGLVGRCYTVAKEIERCNADGSGATANSVRALFNKALLDSDSEVKHSPFLWMMWFHFERSAAEKIETSSSRSLISDTSMQKVRQVFYDGLRLLPWYKPWIVMGMRHVSGSERELQQLYDVMTEREMRIRTEVD